MQAMQHAVVLWIALAGKKNISNTLHVEIYHKLHQ